METLRLINTRDVARRLGVDPRTVHRMVQAGTLDATAVPGYRGNFLFDPDAVEALAQERAR